MAEKQEQKLSYTPQEQLSWAVFPLAVLAVVFLWILNPQVTDRAQMQDMTLWGFVFGMVIGYLRYRMDIKNHFNLRLDGGEYRKNRVPAEFYWGHKKEVLFKKEGDR